VYSAGVQYEVLYYRDVIFHFLSWMIHALSENRSSDVHKEIKIHYMRKRAVLVVATGAGFYGSPYNGFVLLPGHCFVLFLSQLIVSSNEEHEVGMHSVQERAIELFYFSTRTCN
jgi:hypothetical protein